MVVTVFPFPEPKIFVKIMGTKTAMAQIRPKPITKANVFGQVEQPKQPSVDASSSCSVGRDCSISGDAFSDENPCSDDTVNEVLPFKSTDEGDY
jgi:hypothetical protein